MPINQDLLDILACPETKQPLTLATSELLNKINQHIRSGSCKNRHGDTVAEPIEGGLVREDGKYLYPIRDEIPIMLMDEAIPLP